MARIAMIEQSVKDADKFNKLLYDLLQHITYILENPYDYDLRTLKSDVVEDLHKYDTFIDYLKYLGFESAESHFVYPKELTLNNLRMAQAAIERKINFCSGKHIAKQNFKSRLRQAKKIVLEPTNILNTTAPSLLLRIENLFNHVLEYEDEELQALARDQIPLVTLQLMALDRVREQQRKIKTGEIKDKDLPFDMALLLELMGWFKHKFFSWVDQPPCDNCDETTVLSETSSGTIEGETCRIEVYECNKCGPEGGALFPRHNRPSTLLRTRRGRCGEWANCFALLCRALGYETRYIYDTTDHVWCEVYDYESKSWLHVDPCEGKLNAPLIYEHGWGKQLSYIIAVSRDDVQDVTWRYTSDHKKVLARRNQCSEQELLSTLMSLREHRQRQLSEARRDYLARRTIMELVSLMQERKPTDFESHGRISGSKQWRSDREEAGRNHTFHFNSLGDHTVAYNAGNDTYVVSEPGNQTPIRGWISGVFHSENVFRKVETDWQMVYLAREEGESMGSVSWRFQAGDHLRLTNIKLRARTATYENGSIHWSVQYDDQETRVPVHLDENGGMVFLDGHNCSYHTVVVRAVLRDGRGDVAWQHAQLCRSPIADETPALYFSARVLKN